MNLNNELVINRPSYRQLKIPEKNKELNYVFFIYNKVP